MTFSLVGSVIDLVVTVLTAGGLAGLFALMVVESFGVPPLPSEVILPFAGFLVGTGVFPLVPTVVLALGGALLGAYIAYAIGRWWRDRITHWRVGPVGLEERHLVRMDAWFARHGELTVALARSLPVIRAYISYPAGTARMSPVRFGVYTLVGSLPWTLALIEAGILLGQRWTAVQAYLAPLDYVVYALIVVGVVYGLILYLRTRRIARANPPAPTTGPESPRP